MTPTGKAALGVYRSTLYSHKEGLSLPVRGKLKE